MDINNNPIVVFIETLYAQNPILTMIIGGVALIVFGYITIPLLVIAFIVTQFPLAFMQLVHSLAVFISTALHGSSPWPLS